MTTQRPPHKLIQWVIYFIVLCAIHWSARHQPYWWDALGYVFAHAVEIHDAHLFPILQQWDVGHPTAFFFLLAAVMKVFGVGPFAGHFLNLCFASLLAWSAHSLAQLMGATRSAAIACTAAVMTFPLVFAATRMITPDLALTALLVAALWSWITRRWRLYLVFGSLAVLTKFTGFLLVPAMVCAVFASPRSDIISRRREMYWTLAPLISMIMFLVIRFLVRGPGLTIGWQPMQHLAVMWHWGAFRENWTHASTQLWRISRISWPLMAAAGAMILLGIERVFLKRHHHASRPDCPDTRRAIIATLLLGFTYAGAHVQLTALLPRFGLPLVVLAFLILTWGLVKLPGRSITATIVCSIFVLLNVSQWYPDWHNRLPGMQPTWLCPAQTQLGHNQEIDLRYQDAIELICWAAEEIHADAGLRGNPGTPGVMTQWPLTKALADPRLGYVELSFPTKGLGHWKRVTPATHPYVLLITGVTRMAHDPIQCPFPTQVVASRKLGEFTVHIWRVSEEAM